MTEINMLDSSRSSHLASSICGKDFLELVWENGEILVKGGSSNRTRNTPWYIEYSTNPSLNEEDASPTKRARLSTSHSLLDRFPAQRDSDLSSSRQSNGLDSCLQSSLSKNSFKPKDQQLPNLGLAKDYSKLTGGAQQPVTASNSHVYTHSSQQCFPSNPLKKPRMDSTHPSQTPTTNSQKQNLGCDQRTRRVNFSNFLIPSVFLKSTSHQNSARNASSARVEEIELKAAAAATSNKASDQPAVIESAKGSHGVAGFQERTSLTAKKSNLAPLGEKTAEPVVPLDEHSEAVGHSSGLGSHGQYNNQTTRSAALRAKGKANSTNLCNERASSSVCSLGASNNVPNFAIRNHEDADDSTNLSDNDEEPENIVKEMAARKGNRLKRSRNTENHNLSERKRRDKINEKIRILKGLIPNCNKKDKASMLDDAIDYLKTLKLQLQIMSMGNGLCMPLMMLPAAAHHLNAPHLPQLMGAGMGFRPPQFPIPPLPGVTDSRLHQMFGFSNQIPPMPIPNAPFLPIIGNPSSTQQPLMATSTATNLANSAQLTGLEVSVPNNSDLYAKADNATKQAQNQVSPLQH